MHVVITGAAGFLGRRLADRLLARGTLAGRDGRQQAIDQITLLDIVAPVGVSDGRVRVVTGDVSDQGVLRSAIDDETDAVFHLAAVVSGMAEADFDLGMRINLDATRRLLDVCRERGRRPRVVFTSSVAVYGGALPAVVDDATPITPQSSYGSEKAAAELLVCDYSRRGFVDGRVLRLPTISVRPGRPNTALSSFASAIIREPLNGETTVCPVERRARLWLLSPARAIDGLVVGHDLPAAAWGDRPVVNLPGISVTVGEMVAALERLAGRDTVDQIRWQPDPVVARIVASWPGAIDTARAHALGFPADDSFDAIVQQYVDEFAGQRH